MVGLPDQRDIVILDEPAGACRAVVVPAGLRLYEVFFAGFRAGGRVALLVDLGGAVEGFGDAGADIFGADVALEFGLPHELRGLLAGAAEQKRAAGFVKLVGKIFDGAEAGGVDGGHVA